MMDQNYLLYYFHFDCFNQLKEFASFLKRRIADFFQDHVRNKNLIATLLYFLKELERCLLFFRGVIREIKIPHRRF